MSKVYTTSELLRQLNLPSEKATHLEEALTHRTFAVESALNYDNQRLEFLGDAVLEVILSDALFQKFPDASEGVMTQLRSALACEVALAERAGKLRLGELLKFGNGEKTSAVKRSILADAFEAVLGAIYLDYGMDAARNMVLDGLDFECVNPQNTLPRINPKGRLQELSQHCLGCTPSYRVLNSFGPSHRPIFEVEVVVKNFVATGSGGSRKDAECAAAEVLGEFLEKRMAKHEVHS